MNLSIYSEKPFVDVGQTMSEWFGAPTDTAIVDIGILFSYLFLFVFVLSIFGLLFKGYRR